MTKKKPNSRDKFGEAAADAAYRRGFHITTLADIATEAGLPLGNVYYYFKTKQEIGAAVIDLRLSRLRATLAECDPFRDPRERLCAYVDESIKAREDLARFGCPMGTLCSEVNKQTGETAKKSRVLFAEALAWMQTQFSALRKAEDSVGLAFHLLSATQGMSVLAHAFHEPVMIDMEAARLKKWIRSL